MITKFSPFSFKNLMSTWLIVAAFQVPALCAQVRQPSKQETQRITQALTSIRSSLGRGNAEKALEIIESEKSRLDLQADFALNYLAELTREHARVLETQGKFDEAIDVFQKLYELSAKNSNAKGADDAQLITMKDYITSLQAITKLDAAAQKELSVARSKLNTYFSARSIHSKITECKAAFELIKQHLATNNFMFADAKMQTVMLTRNAGAKPETTIQGLLEVETLYRKCFHSSNSKTVSLKILLGQNYTVLGNLKKAEQALLDSLAQCNALYGGNVDSLKLTAQQALARIYIRTNQPTEAAYQLAAALEQCEILYGESSIEAVDMLWEFGGIAISAQDWVQAEKHLETGLRLLAEIPKNQVNMSRLETSRARLNSYLGYVHISTGRFESAETHLQESVQILSKYKNNNRHLESLIDAMLRLSMAQIKQQTSSVTAEQLQEISDLLDSSTNSLFNNQRRGLLASIYFNRAEYELALNLFQQMIEQFEAKMMPVPDFILKESALSFVGLRDFGKGRAMFDRVLQSRMDNFQKQITPLPLHLAIANTTTLNTTVRNSVAADSSEDAAIPRLFTKINQHKSLLSRSIANRNRQLAESTRTEIYKQFRQKSLALDANIFNSVIWSRKETVSEHEQETIRALELEKETLLRELVTGIEFRKDEAGLQLLAKLNRSLTSREAILEFFLGDQLIDDGNLVPHLFCIVIRKHAGADLPQLDLVNLGNANELNKLAHSWIGEIGTDAKLGLARGLKRVRQAVQPLTITALAIQKKIWQPIQTKLGTCDQILVCPADYLAALPIHAIAGKQQGKYLIHDYSFSYFENAHQVWASRTSTTSNLEPAIGLVGNIDYGEVNADAKFFQWESIPATASEIETIKEIVGDTRIKRELNGRDATRNSVIKILQNSNLIHFATHGASLDDGKPNEIFIQVEKQNLSDSKQKLSARHPFSMSGLVLSNANAPAQKPGEYKFLTGESIIGLDLNHIDLVVLSACDAGRGLTTPSEGVFGIVKAFRYSGARTVVASSWPVDDRLTSIMMADFYKNVLQQNMGKADAMRQVMIKQADSGLPPEFWASWKVYGSSD